MNIPRSQDAVSPLHVKGKVAALLGLALLLTATALPSAQAEEGGQGLRMLGFLDGTCVAGLQEVKFECSGRVSWMLLSNGRAVITFFSPDGKSAFTMAGGGDRQPTVNDYYQKIDTVRLMKGETISYENRRANGECYFRVSDDGKTIHKLKCEVSEKNRNHAIGLEPISKTEITLF
jgi:hypothetical protein